MPENGANGLKSQFHGWLTRLKRSGAPLWFLKTHGGRYQRAGVVDYLICAGGQLIAIELKAPEERPVPSPAQAIELRDLNRAGAWILCTNSLSEAQALVNQALTLVRTR